MVTRYTDEAELHRHLVQEYRLRFRGPAQAEYHARWKRRLVRSLGLPRDVRVLDLGCGTAVLLRALAQQLNAVYGLDISPEMIAEIDIASPALKRVLVSRGEDLPWPSE